MMLIQNGTQGPTTPPTKQPASGTPGYAYGGPPGATSVTRWDPDVANTIIAELAAIATVSGATLDPNNNAQVLAAIRWLIGGAFPVSVGSVTTNTTLTTDNNGQFIDVSGSGITITLPAASSAAKMSVGFIASPGTTLTTAGGYIIGTPAANVTSLVMGGGDFIALQSDGANWRIFSASPGLISAHGLQSFNSNTSFTVPAGVYSLDIEGWGGGGGGGGTSGGSTQGAGGGGGGGSYARKVASVTPGQVLTITVGLPGAGGASAGGTGSAGGITSVAIGGSTLIAANGGAPGVGTTSSTLGVGGSGGAAGIGDIVIAGSPGGNGQNVGGSTIGLGGFGGSAPFGGVGVPYSEGSAAVPAGLPGGGGCGAGGGAGAQVGDSGAQGLVFIKW